MRIFQMEAAAFKATQQGFNFSSFGVFFNGLIPLLVSCYD